MDDPGDRPTPRLLAELGLPDGDRTADHRSPHQFPDGAHYRVEIPSVEGPRCVEAVLAEARLDVPVTRVSQGTGVGLLTDGEIADMVAMTAAAGVELCLFARPCAGWDASAMARSPAGAVVASSVRGQDMLAAAVDEIRRAADSGVRSVLVADLGLLSVESPDNLGGFVRHYELPRLVTCAAPVYVKFGLRNAADVYPSGTHLDDLAVVLSRERVRRARLGLDLLARSGSTATGSAPGAAGLALPVPGGGR